MSTPSILPAGQMFKKSFREEHCINGPYYEFDVGPRGNKRACRVLHDEAGWYWFYGIHFDTDKDVGQTMWCISCGLEDTKEAAVEACAKEAKEAITWVI